MFIKRFILVVLVLAGVMVPRMSAQASPQTAGAEVFVQTLANKAIATVAATDIPESERTKRFRDLFTTSFDVPKIGTFVLGRYWRTATEVEKHEFLGLFEDVNVLTWVSRFKNYRGQTLTVTGSKFGNGEDILVESAVEQKEGPPLTVVWQLATEGANYRVLDLVVDGVSMAITYRSEYTSVMQRNGSGMSGLMTALRSKVAQLQASPDSASTR